MFCKNIKFGLRNPLFRYSTTASKTGKIKDTGTIDFSQEEEAKILHALNQETPDILSRLKIPESYMKKLETWKAKKGPFLSIDDILGVEGMDIKNLAKICQSVALDKPIQNKGKIANSKYRQNVSPVLTSDTMNTINSTVGLHLGPTGISWARLSRKMKLDIWNFKDFSELSTKPTSTENFELATSILDDIPVGDVYIFETLPGLGLQAQGQLGSVLSHIQQIEFNSMLLTLLNTSEKHNKIISKTEPKRFHNVVYFMKAKLAARLFQTWVGSEKVSAITTVKQLLDGANDLPCTPLLTDRIIKEKFDHHGSIHKELLSQPLLLSIAFLDLCVYKNPVSLEAISPTKKKIR